MLGELCALGASLVWSISVILFKRSEAIDPQGLNLFKNVTASLLLVLTLPLLGVGIAWDRPEADWWLLVASGVLGISLADTLIFTALRKLGAGLLAVVDCAYAPSIVLFSVVALDERVGLGFALGGLLVVGGVLYATTDKVRLAETSEDERRSRAWGVVFGVAGIVAMAIGVILAKPVLERSHLAEVTLVRLLAGVGGQLLWMTFHRSQRSALRALIPSRTWKTLLPASVLGSYVAMLLWLGGFKWAPASVASVLNQTSTVFTIVLARVVLQEPVSPRRALGAAGAIAGAALVILT